MFAQFFKCESLGSKRLGTKHPGAKCPCSRSEPNRTLGFLRRNLYSCPQEVKEAAYKGLVRPVLDYGSSVWDPPGVPDASLVRNVCLLNFLSANP